MLRKIGYSLISILFLHVFCVSSVFAQYAADALLVKGSDNMAVISCSAVGKNKKEAIEEAKKAAIYTYLFNGITGLNNDQPMLGYKPSDKAKNMVMVF